MKDYRGEFEYKGKVYKLMFNLNVMEQIQDEYGSIDKWGKLTEGENGEPNVKAVKFGFTAMINEGIDIENESLEEPRPLLTTKQVGRLITKMGTENAVTQLNNAIVESTKSEEKN